MKIETKKFSISVIQVSYPHFSIPEDLGINQVQPLTRRKEIQLSFHQVSPLSPVNPGSGALFTDFQPSCHRTHSVVVRICVFTNAHKETDFRVFLSGFW